MHSLTSPSPKPDTVPLGGAPRPPSILLVEDNRANRILIRTYVDGFGYRSAPVHSGEAALEFVRHNPCDLVLMDIQMPGMDGIQTTQAIRALGGKFKSLPIIALTASAGQDETAGFLAAGLDGVVTKPIDPVDLLAKITDFLGEPPAPH